MTDSPERGGCLWWFFTIAAMLVSCVGMAAVTESTAMHCPEGNLSMTCASRVLDDLTSVRGPVRSSD